MAPSPLIMQVQGRDVLSFNRSEWSGMVRSVGGALVRMPCPLRWITVSRPATMRERRATIAAQLDTAPTDRLREMLHSELVQLDDLVALGVKDVEHYMLAWPTTELQRQTIPSLLQHVMGDVTVIQRMPNLWGGSRYRTTMYGMSSHDTGVPHVWQGTISDRLMGAILPDSLHRVIRQPFPCIIVIDVTSHEPHQARNILDVSRQRFEAHSVGYTEYNEERRVGYRDWQQASAVIQDGSLLSMVRMAVFVQGFNDEDARQCIHRVTDSIGTWTSFRPMLGRQQTLAQLLTTTAPDAVALPVRGHACVTPQVATLLPWGLGSTPHADGLMLGFDTARGTVVRRPPDDLANLHATFFGMSGSGKTTLAVMWLHRLITLFGVQGIVIDPQNAFESMAHAYPDGSYNRVTLDTRSTTPIHVNILDVIVEDVVRDLLEQVTHVEGVLTWMNQEPFTSAQRTALIHALTVLYQTWPGLDSRDLTTMPVLGDLVTVITAEGDSSGLAEQLIGWTRSPFDRLYNHHTTLNLRMDPAVPLVIYDFDPTMPEHYKMFFMMLISSALRRELRRHPRRAVVVMDEAGMLMLDPVLARLAREFAKVMRRFGVGFWMIDQTLNLLNTDAGDEVFQNAFLTAIGTMKSNQAETLRDLFPMLTDEAIRGLIGLGKSESEVREQAGHFTLIFNNQVFPIYNMMTPYERSLMPRSAVQGGS